MGIKAAVTGAFLGALSIVAAFPACAVTVTEEWNAALSRSYNGNESYITSSTDSSGNTCMVIWDSNWDTRLLIYDSSGSLATNVVLAYNSYSDNFGGMAFDSSGNLILAGTDWGASDEDIFVAKYARTGALLWSSVRTIAGRHEEPHGVAVDSSGNIYVAGDSSPPMPALSGAILMKFNSSGTFQWSRTVGNGGDAAGSGVAVSPSGNAYLCGESYYSDDSSQYMLVAGFTSAGGSLFSRTLTAGGGSWEYARAIAEHSGNLYVAVDEDFLDLWLYGVDGGNGDLLGSGNYSSGGSIVAGSIVVDASGASYIAGYQSNTDYDWFLARFSAGLAYDWLVNKNLSGRDGNGYPGADVKVCLDGGGWIYLSGRTENMDSAYCFSGPEGPAVEKLSSAGTEQWSRVYDGASLSSFRSVRDDGTGNIYAAGRLGESVPILAGYDSSGNRQWVQYLSAPSHCDLYGRDMTVRNGYAFVSGDGFNSATFGMDLLVAAYNSAGGMEYGAVVAYDALGYGSLDGGVIAVDGSYNQYVAGSFQDDNTWTYDLILVKVDVSGTVVWSRTLSHADDDSPTGIALDASGNIYISEDYPEDYMSPAPEQYSLIKFDASGDLQWIKDFPRVVPASDVVQGNDLVCRGGNLWLCGIEYDDATDHEWGTLQKFDTNGNLAWSRQYSGGGDAGFNGVDVDGAGNAFTAGSLSLGVGININAVSYDSSGNVRWSKSWDCGAAGGYARDVAIGSVLVAGVSGNDARLIKYAESAGPSAVLRSALSATPNPLSPGQLTQVVLTVTNTGGGAATGVYPSIEPNSGGGIIELKAGPVPAGPVTIGAGVVQRFTWTCSLTGLGTVALTATAQGTNSGTGGPIETHASAQVVSALRAHLKSAMAVWPSTAYAGQTVNVTFTVTNDGLANALDVAATVFVGPGGARVDWVPSVPPAVPVLSPDNGVTFTWQFTAKDRGPVVFTSTGTGTDPVFGALRTNGWGGAALALPATLSASLYGVPATASVGQRITAVVAVANIGDADATGVSATIYCGPMAAVDVISGPTPTGPVTVAAYSFALFTWTLSASGSGAATLTATATGSDSALGGDVGAAFAKGILIQNPAALSATVWAWPATRRQGELITVTMTLTNTGEASALSVTPLIFFAPPGAVNPVSGPVPAGPVTVAGTKAVTFVWTYEAAQDPGVVFSATAGGVDANSWRYTGDGGITPAIAIAQAAVLRSSAAASPATVKVGEEIELRFTVSDTGDLQADNVGPSLVPGTAGIVEVESGPSPAVKDPLASGGTVVFSWKLRAVKAGELSLTLSATGDDGVYKVGARSTVKVTVNPKYDEDIVVFPNPLKAGKLTVAMKLDGDAERVDIDLFNTAMQRVLAVAWKDVKKSPGEVVLDGLDKVAPGVYLLRAKAKTSAGTRKFPLIKVVVKR